MHFSPTCFQKCERQCSKNDPLPAIIRYSLGKKKNYSIHYLTGQNRGLSWLKNIWPVIMTGDPLSVIFGPGVGEKSISYCKKRSLLNGKTERNEMIQFQAHQRDFNLWKKEKGRYLQVVSQIQSTQDCRKVKVSKACVCSPYLTLRYIKRTSSSHG